VPEGTTEGPEAQDKDTSQLPTLCMYTPCCNSS